MSPNLPAIPMWLWAVFGVLALVQVTLLVIALFDLARRPTYAVTGRRKWPWVVVVVVINALGPILYFVRRRRGGDRGGSARGRGLGVLPRGTLGSHLTLSSPGASTVRQTR